MEWLFKSIKTYWDKYLHFLIGFFLAVLFAKIIYWTSGSHEFFLPIIIVSWIGLFKEERDKNTSGFNPLDLTATICGGILGSLMLYF